MQSTIIGIDLGTTNSLCAVWRDGSAQLIPNALGGNLTPSVVGLDDKGLVLVGQAARERLSTHPALTTAAFKRYMGSQKEVALGERRFRPEELSALVLGSLKADAERFLGAPVTEAVITVPAYFSDAQRKATRIAGQLAGLNVECLLNEPTAAALAYGLHHSEPESKFLVFDLGGGTFDVSILELFEGVMEVRASAGDNFLGGEDFVDALVDAFLREAKDAEVLQAKRHDPHLAAQLRRQGEIVKRRLSDSDQVEFSLDWQGQSWRWSVTEELFLKIAEPLLARVRTPVERALRDARIRAAELDQVVLAGGSTRMPLVRKLVARMFGRMPCMTLHPDEAIALGAAVQAGLKMRDSALGEIVMTDICPYTLGVEVAEQFGHSQIRSGYYLPIIERNTVVPVSREHELATVHDQQREVNVRIFQGESRLVKENIELGLINIRVPPRKAGEIAIRVRFTYDVSGLLEVEALIPQTGERHSLVIEENPGVLNPDEVRQRLQSLAELKIHPREQMANTALMARAARIFEESLGDLRQQIGEAMMRFERVLEAQDLKQIAEFSAQLSRWLDEVEGTSCL
jgi:molecular chaperone HscC